MVEISASGSGEGPGGAASPLQVTIRVGEVRAELVDPRAALHEGRQRGDTEILDERGM